MKTNSLVFISLLLTLGLITSTAFAYNTNSTTITRIAPWSSSTQVQVDKQLTSCGSSTNQLNIKESDSTAGRNFQIALAALLSGKSVNINYSCDDSQPKVISIRIF